MTLNVKIGLAALLLLAGCDSEDLLGNDLIDNEQADISPEGKAKDGRISMKGPGFDFALNVPGGLADHANVDGHSKILYPGATISGMHIAAGDGNKGGVELRFTSRDSMDKILAWYRDPARADGFTLASDRRDGDGFVIEGMTREDRSAFKLRLDPTAGGSKGRLTITERI